MWRVRLLLLLVVATCSASNRGDAASAPADFNTGAQRALFFAWCTGRPVIVPTPGYHKLAAVDRGCARLAQERTETYRALWTAARMNRGLRRGRTFSDIVFSFPFAVCREMTARRLGDYSRDVACSSRDQRMVDTKLDLPALFDAYRGQQLKAPDADISPAAWNDEAKAHIAKLLASDPSAMHLRRYLETIGCRCDMTGTRSLSCSLLLHEIGNHGHTRYALDVAWMIAFKEDRLGQASYIEASLEPHLIP